MVAEHCVEHGMSTTHVGRVWRNSHPVGSRRGSLSEPFGDDVCFVLTSPCQDCSMNTKLLKLHNSCESPAFQEKVAAR
eukprot:6484971-Amphidinium_carterae.1